MKTVAFLLLAVQLYCCHGLEKRQGGTPPPPGTIMMTPPMPTNPPMDTTTKMMVPPSPTPSNDDAAPPSPKQPDISSPKPPMSTSAGPTLKPSADCLDKRDDCRLFGIDSCTGIYSSWARYNCPRYCGFCVNPNDTMVECKDNIQICDQYNAKDLCTAAEFRLFAEDNCRKYCNLCDAKPMANGVGVVNMKPSPNQDAAAADDTSSGSANGTECKDTVDYCWTEPDQNCFGIYEPWARGHCPFRCGFCPEKPKCEDKLDYCSQYDSSSCKDPSFVNWARLNCRKTCNLCASQPSGTTSQGQGGSGSSPTSGVVVTPSNNPNNPSPGLPTGNNPNNPGGSGTISNPNVTIPSGTVLGGGKNTFLIQGPTPLVDGLCFYKGESHLQDKNWYDGCDYVCNCLDAKRNRIICTERCTNWQNTDMPIDGCSWVQESGVCCQRLECNVD